MIKKKIEQWKNNLLDLSKRNRLINYNDTLRSNINIIEPEFNKLFNLLALQEKKLYFSSYVETLSDNGSMIIEEGESGDIRSDRTISEELKTLRSIRGKAKSFIQEQGVNSLYMVFGFAEWFDASTAETFKSPLILAPISLDVKSIVDPFVVEIHDDEIVLNPTFVYKISEEYGIDLPEFDGDLDRIDEYLQDIEELLTPVKGRVLYETSISLLSFMKMNIYYDIIENESKIHDNFFLKALAGDKSDIKEISEDYNEYNHDSRDLPQDTYYVVDADSSQKDAVQYSKMNISFALQGPPGTGKSQTITNIIAQGLADGKKILFVSEKAAALDVVYSRLAQVGLDDFCLMLHSDNKKKREVLEQLDRTYRLKKVNVRDEAIEHLDELNKDRSILNNYVDKLHKVIKPLGKSIYQIIGELAILPNYGDFIFDIKNVHKFSNSKLKENIELLKQLSEVNRNASFSMESNPWKGYKDQSISYDFHQSTKKKLFDCQLSCQKIIKAFQDCNKELELEWVFRIEDISKYKAFLRTVTEGTSDTPVIWLKQEEGFVNDAIKIAKQKKNDIDTYTDYTIEIRRWFKEEFWSIDAQKYLDRIRKLEEMIGDVYNRGSLTFEFITDNYQLCISELKELNGKLLEIDSIIEKANNIVTLKKCKSFKDIVTFNEIIQIINILPKVPKVWFEKATLNAIEKLVEEAEKKSSRILEIDEFISNNYHSNVENIDYIRIHDDYNNKYSNILRVLSKQYREDRSLFINNYKGSFKLNHELIGHHIKLLAERKLSNEWLEANEEKLNELLGESYLSKYTDWNVIKWYILKFKELRKLVGPGFENIKFKSLLSNEKNEQIISTTIEMESYDLKSIENKCLFYINNNKFNGNDIKNISGALIHLSNLINELSKTVTDIRSYEKEKISYSNLTKCLTQKQWIDNLKNDLMTNKESYNELYQNLFVGLETDWEDIIVKLLWLKSFFLNKGEFTLSDKFYNNGISSLEVNSLLKILDDEEQDLRLYRLWLTKTFDKDNNIIADNIYKLEENISLCLNNIDSLQDYIDYNRIEGECKKKQLGKIIELTNGSAEASNDLVSCYLKRFYTLWLDHYVKSHPYIRDFRINQHQEKIKDFKEKDLLSQEVSRARIRSRLINSLPNRNIVPAAGDEISVLQHELGKKSRLMPLRKLFNTIPNLLLKLKPCLLMSPLTVSQLLQADTYQFDIVIFDEASQVKTEDAIGSIMRGKTVIICGDNNQLPPTNFFGTNTSPDEYDIDNEDIYESILEESLVILPNRTLKWHYRSRNESLIAFSNSRIYNDELITFPANIQGMPHEGVEYIKVDNGIYDRGKSRANINEAKKVAELVFEHINLFPDRSLGVVTFSTSQKDAIENAINTIRRKNKKYQNWFSETREGAFFVKNIEMVQGDERDTMIFSIGYAKGKDGKPLSMNFGPLSKSGGERRLNVAITRAKYNVKLVGSIDYTDIDLDRTNSNGTRLLREYIYYAQKGNDKLVHNNIINNELIEASNSIAKRVKKHLISCGYTVDTNVGCSENIIDIAVVHPDMENVYVLGIVFDDIQYKNIRTVSERDRIREAVFEEMGWRLFKLWSPSFINNEDNIFDEIEQAISDSLAIDPKNINVSKQHNKENLNIDQHLQEIKEEKKVEDDTQKYGFKYYEYADLENVKKVKDERNYYSALIREVINVEGVIHYDELYKRVLPYSEYNALKKQFKDMIQDIITKASRTYTQRDNFIMPKKKPEVIVRIPKDKSEKRKIEYIPQEELIKAAVSIVINNFSITKDGLFKEIQRLYMFRSMTPKIKGTFEEVFNKMISENSIQVVDKKLKILNEYQ